MQNLLETLKQLLSKDERFMSEGKLLKNQIMEYALKLDEALIKLLMSDASIKKHFFKEVAGALIFDKEKFLRFVSNKQFLPDSYTAFKNKIGLSDDGMNYLSQRGDVTLVWPYKDCVLEGGQTKKDQQRSEIFWNETLAPDKINRLLEPKVLSNFRRHDKNGDKKVDGVSDADNLIIKGNNLLVLHSLLPSYRGKIKIIYIDPPYNTDTDSFRYNDSFSHSTWLTFIKNRFEIASQLLRKDGVIFVSCDDNEQAYLKVLMDEVFGRDNFITNFAVIRSEGGGLAKHVVKGHDYLLTYSKNLIDFKPLKKEKDIRGKIVTKDGEKYWIEEDWLRKEFGKYGTCLYEEIEKIKGKEKKKEIDEGIKSGLYVLIKKDNKTIVGRYRLIEEDGSKFYSVLKHLNADGKNELKELMGKDVFDFPKPVSLLREIILGATFFKEDKDAIVLDYFAGSSTTAQAVIELNQADSGKRKFILVEQMDYVDSATVPRVVESLKKSQSKDSFVYMELMECNQNFIDQIKKANTKTDLWKIWESMQKTAFLSYCIDLKGIDETASAFEELSLEDQKRFLMEVLDKNMLYVNYSDIDDADYKVSAEDKKLNRQFYPS